MLRIPRRQQEDQEDLSPPHHFGLAIFNVREGRIVKCYYLAEFHIQLGEILLLGLITQKIRGNTEEYCWTENHCECDSVPGISASVCCLECLEYPERSGEMQHR